MRGRRPKATATPSTAPPLCPRWLDQLARDEWARVVPLISDRLAEVDQAALAAYCQVYARWRQCEAKIDEHGLTTGARANPAAKLAESLLKQLRAFASEFGFTPAARGKVGTPAKPDPQVGELEDFLNV